jgi:hypothetical protein
MIQQCRLLRLPRELRDEIIKYVFEDPNQDWLNFKRRKSISSHSITPPTRSLPGICSASKQLHAEATPYFLSLVTPVSLNVATTCWLRAWLATLPSDLGYRSIRALAFRNFHGPEQMKGYELIALCPNLRRLNIMLGDEWSDPGTVPSLAINALSSSVNAYETLENIIAMQQLHKLLEIPALEELEFGFHDWEVAVSEDRARQVKEWLRMKWSARGKEVNVVCRQMLWRERYSSEYGDEVGGGRLSD